MQRLLKWFVFLAVLFGGLGYGAWRGWQWWEWASAPPLVTPMSETEDPPAMQIEIPQGTPAQIIGLKLEDAGVIRSALAWKIWARWLQFQNQTGGFQAGVYRLSPAQPLEAIADRIWDGDVVKYRFTIPEGRSIQEMAAYFEELGFFSAEEFVEATRNVPYAQFPWLPNELPHLEGFLYPDTYQLPDGRLTPEAVIAQMLSRFEEVALPVYRQNPNPLELTLLQWVTLASIVEKESVVEPERTVIAGVFTNRLEKGMRLEADPTVEYGLGIRQTVDKPLTFAQVETPSPYNTYLNPGLPPTPIAAPGVASLEATLAPEDTEYLYFMARYDGTHIFSRTLEEHEAAIATVERDLADRESPSE
ncbi:MAG: endolytic transglycosylase MltG [Cyanobacteriota bacterium]|nr:endolytic transglycosylase MltG [Cyanobacteriota bacterium]